MKKMKKKQSLKQISLKKLTISKLTTPKSIVGGTGICGPGSTNIVCPSFPNRCPPPPSFNGSCGC